MSGSETPELATKLLQARLRQELKPATVRKTSYRDVQKDMALYQQLLALEPGDVAAAPSPAHARRTQAQASEQ